MGSGTETDKETDRKTIRETDRGDRLGNRLGDRPGDRQGDFKRFFEGVFENERSTSSDRRTGRALFWTWFCIVGSSETIVFETFGRHRPPILERETQKSTLPHFFLGNNHIRGTRIDPIEASTLGDFSETLGDFSDRDKETDKETDRKTKEKLTGETD